MIKQWWHGKDVQEADYGTIQNTKHWTSKTAHKTLKFYLKNWQFIITICLSIAGLVLAWKLNI